MGNDAMLDWLEREEERRKRAAKFDRLAHIAAALAERDRALAAIGTEMKERIERELVGVRALLAEAMKVQVGEVTSC